MIPQSGSKKPEIIVDSKVRARYEKLRNEALANQETSNHPLPTHHPFTVVCGQRPRAQADSKIRPYNPEDILELFSSLAHKNPVKVQILLNSFICEHIGAELSFLLLPGYQPRSPCINVMGEKILAKPEPFPLDPKSYSSLYRENLHVATPELSDVQRRIIFDKSSIVVRSYVCIPLKHSGPLEHSALPQFLLGCVNKKWNLGESTNRLTCNSGIWAICEFTRHDVEFVQNFFIHLGPFLHRLIFKHPEHLYLERLNAILVIAGKINRVLGNAEETQRTLLLHTRKLMKVERCAIFTLNVNEDCLEGAILLSSDDNKVYHVRIPKFYGSPGMAFQKGSLRHSNEPGVTDLQPDLDDILGVSTENFLSCPILCKGDVRGVVEFYNREPDDYFCMFDFELVSTISIVASLIYSPT